ncbi:ABC transporter substrate-binding protein [Pantoea sp. At-9b]|uniref:ABC transporter substrate-binding protein n=1 Tax=Pantoea sp. (strain At-9b) TaxID=592316 RepID=UPI0001B3FA8F|nr:ABC transporter substrate-binding protein [Pantoea sp. At-9b]ADU71376.1 periplasmic binding protein [Pantoea sp. At-9b]
MVISRRQLIQGALASAALFSFPLLAAGAPRWVILDWGLTEMALLLGVTPVGVAATDWYRRLFSQPHLPPQVVDVGLLFQPNYETLFELHPTQLLVTPAHRMAEAQLSRIAPLHYFSTSSPHPWQQAQQNLRSLAELAGDVQRAEQVMTSLLARLDQARQHAAHFQPRPLYLLHPLDTLHVLALGQGSLFNDMLALLGLDHPTPFAVSAQGIATLELEQLAQMPPGWLVLLPSWPEVDLNPMLSSPLWHTLTRGGHQIVVLPDGLSTEGGVLTAVRFAESLVSALQEAQP